MDRAVWKVGNAMSDELAKLRERVRQNRTAHKWLLLPLRAGNGLDRALPGGTLAVGDRVFDPVTGEHGEVVGGTRENVVVPTAR